MLNIKKYINLCLLFFLLINVFCFINTYATDKICYENYADINNITSIKYVGNFYGVDIYGNDIDKVNLAIPWIEKISKDFDLDCELILYDDSKFSLNRLIIENTQLIPQNYNLSPIQSVKYEFSNNYFLGNLQGLSGEYNNRYKRIIVSSNLSDMYFQFTVIHEIGHYLDDVNNLSINLTDEQIEKIRQLTIMYNTGKSSDKLFYTRNEAFAEMFLLQQIGVL